MQPTHAARTALGLAMRQRRHELDRTIEQAAKSADLSPTTWLNIEHGRPSRARTQAAIERVLGWLPGSCAALLADGQAKVDPGFEARRQAAAEESDGRLVIVDLSTPKAPGVVILAAGGEVGVSDVTRRSLVAIALEALEVARRRAEGDSGPTIVRRLPR
jgi:DNA-binding XRE family transcriptional regulator